MLNRYTDSDCPFGIFKLFLATKRKKKRKENPPKMCTVNKSSMTSIPSRDIKDPTPVRGQDGQISDTQGKDFWSPTRLAELEINRNLSRGCLRFFRVALLPVFDSFSH